MSTLVSMLSAVQYNRMPFHQLFDWSNCQMTISSYYDGSKVSKMHFECAMSVIYVSLNPSKYTMQCIIIVHGLISLPQSEHRKSLSTNNTSTAAWRTLQMLVCILTTVIFVMISWTESKKSLLPRCARNLRSFTKTTYNCSLYICNSCPVRVKGCEPVRRQIERTRNA